MPSLKPPWLTTDEQLRRLIKRERLRPVLVRYSGATDGRFTAPAQDIPDLLDMLKSTGRYPRDLSL